MASIRKTPHGRWQVMYRDPTGRQRAQNFRLKSEATTFANSTETKKSTGSYVDPAGGKVVLEDWINAWWATTVNLRPATRARDEGTIKNHILEPFGLRRMGTITQLEVKEWVAELTGKLSPATVHKTYQVLSKIMRSAVHAGMLASSPCHDIDLPKIETEEMRFLDPTEITRLAEVMTPRYRAFVYLASYCGLRLSEMAGLRRNRLDLLHSTVTVWEQAVEVRGQIHVGAPKTRAGRRVIPIPRQVAGELEDHLGQWGSADPFGLVFPGRDGGVMRAGAWRRRHWLPAIEAAGVAPLRIHDLRHTAVALWIAAGASDLEVAMRAGHTSVSVVKDRYGHLFPQTISATTAKLEALFDAGVTQPGGEVVSL